MNPSDRTRALNAAWVQLWWLLDPAIDRWAKTHEVLADPTSRLTIEQGSGDNLGRRSKGDHSDPTHAAAAALLEAGLGSRRQARALRRTEADIAETAAFIRSVIGGETVIGSSLAGAVHDIAWCCTIPHTSAAWRTDDDELRREVDHAHHHVSEQAGILASQCRVILASAVREKPQHDQPKLTECRTHKRWAKATGRTGSLPLAVKHGLCDKCADFRRNHKAEPTVSILTRWDGGKLNATPAQILEAKAQSKRSRKVG